MSTLCCVLLAGACTVSLGGTLLEERTETYTLGADAALRIRNVNGNVSVEPWDGAQVEVTLSIYGNASLGVPEGFSLSAVSTPDSLAYTVELPSGHAGMSVSFLVRVPRGHTLDVQVESVNGNVAVEGPHRVGARTTNGGITVTGAIGGSGARTTNGSIHAEFHALQDGMTLKTVNGGIHALLPREAGFTAETVHGTVRVTGFSPEHADRTSASVPGAPSAEMDTVNGNVTVEAN